MALETPEVQENTAGATPAAKPDVPSSKGKNVAIVAIVVLVILVVFVAIWFALKATSTTVTTPPATTQSDEVPAIKSDADLERLENEVRNTDVDGMNTDLDANEADSAPF